MLVRCLLAITICVLAPAALRSQSARTIARYGFTDGALAIEVRPGGIIAIAAAQGDSAATVALRASDARAWVDSTRRFVTRPAPRKRSEVVLQRSMIEESADSGAAISFLRRAERDTTTFQLLFSTRALGKFPLALERREAALFFGAMRRAIAAAHPNAPAKQPKKAKPGSSKTSAAATQPTPKAT